MYLFSYVNQWIFDSTKVALWVGLKFRNVLWSIFQWCHSSVVVIIEYFVNFFIHFANHASCQNFVAAIWCLFLLHYDPLCLITWCLDTQKIEVIRCYIVYFQCLQAYIHKKEPSSLMEGYATQTTLGKYVCQKTF